MRLPQSIGWDIVHMVQQQRADGIDLSTTDASEQWSICTACGSGTIWIDPNGECSVCALSNYREWNHRDGGTDELVSQAIGTDGRHPRILRAAVNLYWAAAQEAFPRQLCAHCGQPAGYSDPGGWHHLTPAPDCWAPWMTH